MLHQRTLSPGRWVLLALVASFLGSARAEDPEEPTKPKYPRFVEIRSWKYVPPRTADDPQTISFVLDIHPDVPKGTRINFELEYRAQPVPHPEDFILESERRKAVKFEWKLKERLATDTYFVRTRIYPSAQPPEVRAKIEANPRKFPPEAAPWQTYYWEDDYAIKIGSEAEKQQEVEAICDAYTKLTDQLVTNMVEWMDAMEDATKGKKFVEGGKLDVEGFTKFVVEWRKKQGELQREIIAFPVKQANFYQRSQKAYEYLQRLGQMVSKQSVALQLEVTEKYKVPVINPRAHPNFDRAYRYVVNADELNKYLDLIFRLACPAAAQGEPADDAEEDASGG